MTVVKYELPTGIRLIYEKRVAHTFCFEQFNMRVGVGILNRLLKLFLELLALEFTSRAAEMNENLNT